MTAAPALRRRPARGVVLYVDFRPGVTSPVPGRQGSRRPVEVGKTAPAAGPLPWWWSARAGRHLVRTAAGLAGVAAFQVVFWKGLPLLHAVAVAWGVAR